MTVARSAFEIVKASVRVLTAPVLDGTAMSFAPLKRRATVLLELETRNGLVGFGESWVNFPEWAPIERLATLREGVLPLLLSEDSRRITYLHRVMTQTLTPVGRQWGAPGPIMQAISAADTALWDLHGKAHGEAISWLAGGRVRDTVPVYASSLGPTLVKEQGLLCMSEGYSAVKVKLGFGRSRDETTLSDAQAACGVEMVLYADANQGWSLAEAIEMAPLLHKYNVAWIEEPIRGNHLVDLEEFYRKTNLPIATGENLYSCEAFMPYINSPAIKIVQPDITKTGGITEVIAICKLAEAMGTDVIPHMYGGAIGFAATLQLAACMPSVTSIEYDIRDNPLRDSLLIDGPKPLNGVITIPDKPGLAIDLDPQAIMAHLKEYV